MTAPTVDLCEGRWPVTRCLSEKCGARIVWARTPAGKNTPVDVDTNPRGSVLLVDRGDRTPVAVVIKPSDRAEHDGKLRTTHWATCKSVGQFRSER